MKRVFAMFLALSFFTSSVVAADDSNNLQKNMISTGLGVAEGALMAGIDIAMAEAVGGQIWPVTWFLTSLGGREFLEKQVAEGFGYSEKDASNSRVVSRWISWLSHCAMYSRLNRLGGGQNDALKPAYVILPLLVLVTHGLRN